MLHFTHMLYKDAVLKYGSDKPDMRFGMELHEVTDCFPPEAKEKKLRDRRQRVCFRRSRRREIIRANSSTISSRKQNPTGRKARISSSSRPKGTTSTVEKLISAENVTKLAQACEAKPGDLVVARLPRKTGNQGHRSRPRLSPVNSACFSAKR